MGVSELTFAETFEVKTGKIVSKDFFYIPVFYFKEASGGGWYWYSLRFNTGPAPDSLTSYASKVGASTSLKNALIRDLDKDFHYPKSQTFVIDEVSLYDSILNRHGERLTRLLVVVGLDEKIPLDSIHPLGMNLFWHEEDYEEWNVVKGYFPQLLHELYQSQSYVHIPMDGSRPADPALGPADEYYRPDGSLIEPSTPIWF